eukprot:2608321-Pyramimonas_sp.AAC.1
MKTKSVLDCLATRSYQGPSRPPPLLARPPPPRATALGLPGLVGRGRAGREKETESCLLYTSPSPRDRSLS